MPYFRAVSSLIVLVTALGANSLAGAPVPRVAHYPPANAEVPRLLAERGRLQAERARNAQADFEFRFTNRIAESGITFHQRSVEDALKWWKPAHYDHGSGLAAADVDGDGRIDLYFVNQLGPNQLWRNVGGGRFEDITERSGTALAGRIHVAAAFGDIDNDGDADLFITTVRGGNVLLENDGQGRFRNISARAGVDYRGHSSGAAFLDFDNDGQLDLLVCNVGVYTGERTGPGGYYRALTNAFHGHVYPGRNERSLLYRNLGGGKFQEIGGRFGLDVRSWSGDVTYADLNADRYPDIYLANMQGDDHYLENDGGRRLLDRTREFFPKTPWGSMGAKFLDFDQDGRLDLYVTDMHSDMTDGQSAAGRGTMRDSFEKLKSERWCTTGWSEAFLQGSSNNIFGNGFYRAKAEPPFEEISQDIGVETYWPWGVSAGDLNADGYDDLFVTAGMGYPFRYGVNSVLLNDRGRGYFDAEFLVGVEPRMNGRISERMFTLDCGGADQRHPLCRGGSSPVEVHGALSSRSSVMLDLDEDGDLDIVTNEQNGRPMVLVSDLAQRRTIRWLQVRLVGARSNRDGLGSLIRVRTGGRTLTQYAEGKSGYLSQSSLPLYFGLGDAKVDAVEVAWPSGQVQIVRDDLPQNGTLTVREPVE